MPELVNIYCHYISAASLYDKSCSENMVCLPLHQSTSVASPVGPSRTLNAHFEFLEQTYRPVFDQISFRDSHAHHYCGLTETYNFSYIDQPIDRPL